MTAKKDFNDILLKDRYLLAQTGYMICIKCGAKKHLEDFKKDKRVKFGRVGKCKSCYHNERQSLHYKLLKAQSDKRYYSSHLEILKPKMAVCAKNWRKNNHKRHLQNGYRWRKNNPEKAKLIDCENKKKRIATLSDYYIRKLAIHDRGYSREQLKEFPGIIETIRTLVKIRRLCKTKHLNSKVLHP